MPLIAPNDVTPGYYIARRKGEENSEFVAVVWGVYPFLQIYALPVNLEGRPHFVDVQAQECEFLSRMPDSAKELSTRLTEVQVK